MAKKTVKRRIFISNTLMVLTTLGIFLILNMVVLKLYLKSIEDEVMVSAQHIIGTGDIGELLESWTIHQNKFILIFGIDGILCIIILLMVSQIFTGDLTKHILEPLEALAKGAKRIKENNLSENVEYLGEIEFEDVCHNFNDMQGHILEEQEKNRKYEKARTDMIAGISHDLRTPLTAVNATIKGMLDGVASTKEQQQKFLEIAYRRTNEMNELLNQLFYFSKLETGNMPFLFENIEITQYLEVYVKSANSLMAEDEEIIINNDGNPVNIWGDAKQLHRILDNLVENSRKYGENKPLKIEINLKKSNDKAFIIFKDNGVGVKEEKLPHIFEEFYRCDSSRNKNKGNGLGLYIVKYLVEEMGGTVQAKNADGLEITLEFPLKKWKETNKNG